MIERVNGGQTGENACVRESEREGGRDVDRGDKTEGEIEIGRDTEMHASMNHGTT